jgi:hypothetical protein
MKFTKEFKTVELTAGQVKRIQEKDTDHLVCVVVEEVNDNPPLYPEGEPEKKWKADELKAYLLDKFDYKAESDTTKAEMLSMIEFLQIPSSKHGNPSNKWTDEDLKVYLETFFEFTDTADMNTAALLEKYAELTAPAK